MCWDQWQKSASLGFLPLLYILASILQLCQSQITGSNSSDNHAQEERRIRWSFFSRQRMPRYKLATTQAAVCHAECVSAREWRQKWFYISMLLPALLGVENSHITARRLRKPQLEGWHGPRRKTGKALLLPQHRVLVGGKGGFWWKHTGYDGEGHSRSRGSKIWPLTRKIMLPRD